MLVQESQTTERRVAWFFWGGFFFSIFDFRSSFSGFQLFDIRHYFSLEKS